LLLEDSRSNLGRVAVMTVALEPSLIAMVKEAAARERNVFVAASCDYSQALMDVRSAQRVQPIESLVCVIDFDRNRGEAVQTADAMQQLIGGRTAVIAVSSDARPELILEAMRAGCSEYLTIPLTVAQFCEALSRLCARWTSTDDNATKPTGKVIGMMGVRGGAGTTTLAVHLGTFLAKQYQQKVLLIDQHPSLGHLALFLGFDSPRYHYYELLANVARLDASLLNSFVVHHASGADLLPSPGTFVQSTSVPSGAVEQALQLAAGIYEYTIIDFSTGLDDLNLSAMGHCDELYLIAPAEIPALRDLSRYIERLRDLHVPSARLKVIVNRYSSDRSLSLDQIEKAIGQPISITIPNWDKELVRAIDNGSPVTPDRKSEFVNQMKKWATSLLPPQATKVEAKRKLAFWGRSLTSETV
jgi:pilus assembly protein CpaE